MKALVRSMEPWLSLVMIVAAWEAVGLIAGSREFPSFSQVMGTMVALASVGLETGGERLVLANAAMVSLGSLSVGLAAATALGVCLGLLLGQSPTADRLMRVPIGLARPVPPSALVPFFVVLLGIGEATTFSLVTFGAFFPIFLSTYSAVRTVDPIYLQAAAVLGATPRSMFPYVVLPAALPGILTGIRVGWQVAWAVLIMAELIVSRGGLGSIMLKGETARRYEVVLAGMVVIALLGLAFDLCFRLLQDRLLRWQAGLVAS